MANLWKKLDLFLESLDNISDPKVKQIFMEYYWHIPKFSGSVDHLRPTKYLILAILRFIIYTATLVWHAILFLFSIPYIIGDLHLFIRIFHFALFCWYTTFVHFWFSTQRKTIIKAHRFIAYELNVYGVEGEIIIAELSKKFRYTYFISLAILPFILCITVIFVFFASLVDEASGAPPKLDPKNGVDVNLPLPLWYPWDINSWHTFQLVHEIFLAFIVGMIILNVALIYVNIAYTLCMHLILLQISLKNLEERAVKMYEQLYPDQHSNKIYEDAKFLQCYEYCLRTNIIHHQKILELFGMLLPIANAPIFLAISMLAIVLAISGVDLVTAGDKTGDMILNVLLCLTELTVMAIVSWYGQRIIDLSEEVREAVYDSKWYLCNPRIKKIILIMQTRTTKPMVVMGGIWPCNHETFQAVVNTAYSYFNILLAFNSE